MLSQFQIEFDTIFSLIVIYFFFIYKSFPIIFINTKIEFPNHFDYSRAEVFLN